MNQIIRNHFKKHDSTLFSYIEKIKVEFNYLPDDLFSELCEIIISQQLSGKAADTIFDRLENLFPDKKISPKTLLRLSELKIKSCGTSKAKVKALKDLAKKVNSGELDLDSLKKQSDEDVIKELIKVKGIGPWSAEMFLIFGLGREDVFSHGDLGLRKAIKQIYGFKKEPSVKQVGEIIAKWKPYRTYASLVLWRILEVK